jgi:hypothetical protein
MDVPVTATHYEIRIRGVLSDRLLVAFPNLDAHSHEGETILAGALPDQSSLYGVLGEIEALGLELLEVRLVRPGLEAPSVRAT